MFSQHELFLIGHHMEVHHLAILSQIWGGWVKGSNKILFHQAVSQRTRVPMYVSQSTPHTIVLQIYPTNRPCKYRPQNLVAGHKLASNPHRQPIGQKPAIVLPGQPCTWLHAIPVVHVPSSRTDPPPCRLVRLSTLPEGVILFQCAEIHPLIQQS